MIEKWENHGGTTVVRRWYDGGTTVRRYGWKREIRRGLWYEDGGKKFITYDSK